MATEKVHLLAGTHKGGFLFMNHSDRKNWDITGPFFKGNDVHHMVFDTRNEPAIFASTNSMWWGPSVRFSKDLGETWQEPESDVRFEQGSDKKVKRVWCVEPGRTTGF